MNTEQSLIAPESQNHLTHALDELGLSIEDLNIPRLLLMHNSSDLVGSGEAKLGDIVNSQTNEIVGGIDKPVEILPLHLYKTIRITDVSGGAGRGKWLRDEAVTLANTHLIKLRRGKENGVDVTYDLCMNYYVLLNKDIESGLIMPAIVTFKKSSLRTGQQIASNTLTFKMAGKPSYAYSTLLSSKKEKMESAVYAVFKCIPGKATSAAGLEAAEKWNAILATKQPRVTPEMETMPIPEVIGVEEKDVF